MRAAFAVLVGALAFAAPAAAQDRAAIAGGYQVDQMEVGGGLLLAADGRFRYALEYGAVSETAEGRWTVEGGTVRLTSEPKVKPPAFAVVKDEPAPAGELRVALADPGFDWGDPLEVAIAFEGQAGRRLRAVGKDGLVPLEAGEIPVSVVPVMPVYGIAEPPHPLTPGGHRILFRFDANDFGRADFNGEPLRIDGTNLVLNRYDIAIRFKRFDDPAE
ncbi:MAG: hypothetical protein ACO1O3_13260 [Sphingobium sp.]